MPADGGNDRSSLWGSASDLTSGRARATRPSRPSGRAAIGRLIRPPLALRPVGFDRPITMAASGGAVLLPHLTLPNRARPGLFAVWASV